MTGSSDAGVTTLRVPDQHQTTIPPHSQYIRETDIEVCFVCKKCRIAFTTESTLLTHQRQCFGGDLNNRGAFRLVQTGYECKLCPPVAGDRFKTSFELKKHCETIEHCSRLHQQQQQQQQQQQGSKVLPPPPSESPLSHEMEDVVNQITLLAARAAQEANPNVDSNSNSFCQPGDTKRRFLPPGDVTQPCAGH